MISVVNKYKHKPTDNDIYIGRGSVLGNPFTSKSLAKTKAKFECDSRQESISNFEQYILAKIKIKDKEICHALNEIFKKAKNGDVNLLCFCSPQQCHGDVIKKIIEEKL